MFTTVLLVIVYVIFINVYSYLPMFTIVFICLFLFSCVYLCLDLFTRVYSCSLVFTYVYTEMDKMEKAASSEIDNFDIWEKDQQEALTLICEKKSPRSICRLEAFRLLCTYVAIGCEGY